MILADHYHEAIMSDEFDRHARIIDDALDETEVSGADIDGVKALGRVAGRKPQIDLRMEFPEIHEMLRQPIAGDRLAGENGKAAARCATEIGQYRFSRAHRRKNCTRFAGKDPALLRQLDPTPDTVEKLDVVAAFQRCNCATDRRLGEIEAFGGTGHVLALGDGQKYSELIKRHECHSPTYGAVTVP